MLPIANHEGYGVHANRRVKTWNQQWKTSMFLCVFISSWCNQTNCYLLLFWSKSKYLFHSTAIIYFRIRPFKIECVFCIRKFWKLNTQHKSQKFTRASVVKRHDFNGIACWQDDWPLSIPYLLRCSLLFGIKMHLKDLNYCFPQVASPVRAMRSIWELQDGNEYII